MQTCLVVFPGQTAGESARDVLHSLEGETGRLLLGEDSARPPQDRADDLTGVSKTHTSCT